MWLRLNNVYNKFIVRQRKVILLNQKQVRFTSKSTDSTITNSDDCPPKEAQVVICGGGVMGGSVAYHLSLMGLGSETVVVESSRCILFYLKLIIKNIIVALPLCN